MIFMNSYMNAGMNSSTSEFRSEFMKLMNSMTLNSYVFRIHQLRSVNWVCNSVMLPAAVGRGGRLRGTPCRC